MEGIDHLLSLEVKKEIADRYFGFRKVIEEDTQAYLENIQKLSAEFEQIVTTDFRRLHSLLGDDLFKDFLRLCSLPEDLFADTSRTSPAERRKLFADNHIRGFTRKGCLRNMFFDAYADLYRHLVDYTTSYRNLQEDHQTICEQIKIFYRKNDISTIFHFLRGLESGHGGEDLGFNSTSSDELEKKMQIEPPPPVEEMLTYIPQPPPEKSIRGELKKLVVKACRRHPRLDPRDFK